jgi:hypothetical protein
MSAGRFSSVRTGIRCVLWGVVTYLILVALYLFVTDSSAGTIIGVAGLGALILIVFGQILCLSVPPEMPGSGMIYGSVTCTVGAILLIGSLFFWDPAAVLGNLMSRMGMIMLAMVLFFMGDILFNFFLRYLAQYVHDSRNAGLASMLIKLKLAVLAMQGFAVVLLFTWSRHGAVIVMVLAGIILLIILFNYISLLSGLTYSILRATRPAFDPSVRDEVMENPFENMDS